MKKQFINTALGVVVALTALVGSANATPFITFNVGAYSPGGTFQLSSTVNAGLYDVTNLSNILFNSLQVFSDTADPGNPIYNLTHWTGTAVAEGALLNYNTTTKTLTLTGCISGLAGLSECDATSSNYNLVQMGFGTGASALGAPTNGSTATVGFNTATSLTDNSILLADLYLSSPVQSAGNGVTGTVSAGTYTASSNQITETFTQLATPEPMSFLLMGSGFLALTFVRRKKLFA
jgi:hypothetical protein